MSDLDAVARLVAACEQETPDLDEQVMLLYVVLVERMLRQRTQALAIPGGFPDVQARQVLALKNMLTLVESDVPDLEMERLEQEGDAEGVLKHLKKLQDDIEKGGA